MAETQLKLHALFMREEGGAYASLCPELDVASQGDNREDALANLKEATDLFLQYAYPWELKRRLTNDITAMLTDWNALDMKAEIEASRARFYLNVKDAIDAHPLQSPPAPTNYSPNGINPFVRNYEFLEYARA